MLSVACHCGIEVQVVYPATSATDTAFDLQDVKISVIGSEIVDPTWVSQAYHAHQPAVHSSSRVCLPSFASFKQQIDERI